MSRVFKPVWRVIVFPFVLVYNLITFPFRVGKRFVQFLESDPEKHTVESLWEHVEHLRIHLLRMILVLSGAVIASFWFTLPLMEYLSRPVKGLTNLQAIEVTEEIGVFMRVALTSGITIALPYIAFEIWLFAAPGLTPRERKYGLIGIPLATLLFVLGVAFTFYILIPAALPFLGGFTDISQFWTAKEYFGFITGLMLWIGIFFEFPLVVYVLTSIGLLRPRMLAQQWRLAIVVIAVLAAAVTPTVDPVNMGLVMLPMILLYFVSIGMSQIAYAGRKRNASAAETPEGETQAQAG
jgi:sec-independent protein translocase protein TatC